MAFKSCVFLQIIIKTIEKNYYNSDISLSVYKFIYKIAKIANNITKIPRTVKEVASYLQKSSLFGS